MTLTLPPVGSIGLVKVDGVTGEAIRLGEILDGDGLADSKYQHAFVLESKAATATAQVIEAEPGGVRRTFLSEYAGREILWIPCPDEYQDAMVKAADTYLGIGYSFADYPAIAAHHLGLDPLHLVRGVVERSGHVMCSQMAAACVAKSGWPLIPAGSWPGYVTPARMAAYAPPGSVPVVLA